MRYSLALLATGTLLLAACQPPDDDQSKDKTSGDGAPIQESQPGERVGGDDTGQPQATVDTAGAPSAQDRQPAPKGKTATYKSDEYGVAVTFPRNLKVINSRAGSISRTDPDFNGSDRQSQTSGDQGGWRAFAGKDEDGKRLLTLKVPDQQARFQLGVSRSTQGLSHCKDQPTGAAGDTETSRTIDGVPFRRYEVTETGENGYRLLQSYRATYGEACYAIDLIASGEGDAGDSEAQKQALEDLQTVIDGIRFTE